RTLIGTGIAMALPNSTYGRVAPRSGLAVKHGIDVGAGVIDSGYRGEIKILLINNGAKTFEVHPGDRIAQLILERIDHTEIVEAASLSRTERGTQGFGSTGITKTSHSSQETDNSSPHGIGKTTEITEISHQQLSDLAREDVELFAVRITEPK